jgi:mRNA deadenylase 3'-5' endonuclease subunit Ccr4
MAQLMAKCIVCDGSGYLHRETCPLCDGVIGWPEVEEPLQQIDFPLRFGKVKMEPFLERLSEQMRRRLLMRNPQNQLSISSFNMLLKGFDNKPYYPSVPMKFRSWPRRRELLLQLIQGVSADVYCMQEVECSSFAEESRFLKEIGYAWVEPKDDAKGKWPDMAKPAFFYKADRLELLWTDHRSRVVLASFRHQGNGQIVYMATCHLEGAPWEAEKRISQTKKALDSVQRRMVADQKAFGLDNNKGTLVFAGDFNEEETGAVCHLLRSGHLDTSFRAPGLPDTELTKTNCSHGFGLSELYASSATRPSTFCAPPESASEPQEISSSIDFMFYSHAALRPVAVREPITVEQAHAMRGIGIPSEWHISDHVPIGGVFDFVSDGDVSPIAPAMV